MLAAIVAEKDFESGDWTLAAGLTDNCGQRRNDVCNSSRRKTAASAGTARDGDDDISSREIALVTACQKQSKVWPQPVRDRAKSGHSLSETEQGVATACQRQTKVWPQPVRDRARCGHSLSETEQGVATACQRQS